MPLVIKKVSVAPQTREPLEMRISKRISIIPHLKREEQVFCYSKVYNFLCFANTILFYQLKVNHDEHEYYIIRGTFADHPERSQIHIILKTENTNTFQSIVDYITLCFPRINSFDHSLRLQLK